MHSSNGLCKLYISAVLLVFHAGCTLEVYNQSGLPRCASVLCPTGTHCDAGEQVCLPDTQTCGNGVVDPGEVCDDGPNNATLGDSCSATCQAATSIMLTGVADPKYLITGTRVTSTAHAVLKMIFEDRTAGTNVSLCAGLIDDFVRGACSMELSDSGGPGFQFLTIIDASALSGEVLYVIRQVGTLPAQFALTIE